MARKRKRPVPKVGDKLWVREPGGTKTRQVEVISVDENSFATHDHELKITAWWTLATWEFTAGIDQRSEWTSIPYRLTMTKGNPNAGQHTTSEKKAQGKLLYPLAKKQISTLHYKIVRDALDRRKTPQEDIRRWCLEGAIREGLIPVEVNL